MPNLTKPEEVLTWLLIGAVAVIGFFLREWYLRTTSTKDPASKSRNLIFDKLDKIIDNQGHFDTKIGVMSEKIDNTEGMITDLKEDIRDHNRRLTKLELDHAAFHHKKP